MLNIGYPGWIWAIIRGVDASNHPGMWMQAIIRGCGSGNHPWVWMQVNHPGMGVFLFSSSNPCYTLI
jgi:hypothetical protein